MRNCGRTSILTRKPCWFGVVAWLVAAGCQLTPAPQLVTCPLSSADQVAEILQIVPIGTSREDVPAKLKAAGIAGGFNTNRSIYYCDLWKRDGDLRWHINVSLLFDEQGLLYATQPDATGKVDPSPAKSVSAQAQPLSS